MKLKFKKNYYNDEDEILFGKLEKFSKFNSNVKNKNQSSNYNIKYSNSDKNYFNNIIKTDENFLPLNEADTKKEINYYNSSDFKKFDYLNKFDEYKNSINQVDNENKTYQAYTSEDYGKFNNIIKTENKEEKTLKNIKQKVKIIDYSKLKESERKIKNKAGIEKIKIVYFD